MSLINKNRRVFFKYVATTVGVATIGATNALGKTSKNAANYVESPKNGEKCSNCVHFEKDTSTCAIVKGKVAPNAWCTYYLSDSVKK